MNSFRVFLLKNGDMITVVPLATPSAILCDLSMKLEDFGMLDLHHMLASHGCC